MTALFSRSTEPVDPGLLSRALEVAGRLANDAAEVIAATAAGARRNGTGRVGGHAEAHLYDWVTDTDRTLERHTRRVLAGEFPDVPVVGPRYGSGHAAGTERTRYRWLVAPLDGVANYLAGLPWYSYGLALVDASGPVVGVISEPGRGEIYAAARGRGTRVNGVPVRIPDRVAAGLALALEAGAVVLHRHGRPDPIPTGGLLVAAPSTASVVLDRWRAAASPRRTEPG